MAHEGLERWGVGADVRDRYLGVIEQRAKSGRNGASWQAETVHALEERGLGRRRGADQDARPLPRGDARERTGAHLAGALTSPGPAMFDPADPAFLADPYPAFAAAAGAGPGALARRRSACYVALSHAACDAVLRDRSLGRIWHDRRAGRALPGVQPAAPDLDAGERAADPHPAATAGRRGLRPRARRADAALGRTALADRLVADLAGATVAGTAAAAPTWSPPSPSRCRSR